MPHPFWIAKHWAVIFDEGSNLLEVLGSKKKISITIVVINPNRVESIF
jgi:hypothetical protein